MIDAKYPEVGTEIIIIKDIGGDVPIGTRVAVTGYRKFGAHEYVTIAHGKAAELLVYHGDYVLADAPTSAAQDIRRGDVVVIKKDECGAPVGTLVVVDKVYQNQLTYFDSNGYNFCAGLDGYVEKVSWFNRDIVLDRIKHHASEAITNDGVFLELHMNALSAYHNMMKEFCNGYH